MGKKKIVLIVNPVSGSSSKANWLELAQKELSADFDLQVKYTEYKGHACLIAKEAAEAAVDIVVAVGGDGTVNEVARSLIGTNTALAIFPTGSGNGLARDLGISPSNKRGAIDIIKNGRVAVIDYGEAANMPFFCTSGIGFDATVSREIVRSGKRGFVMYFMTCAREFFRYKPAKCTLEYDGKKQEREVFVVNCANIRQFGFNAYIAPQADFTDGLLNVTIVKPFGFFVALKLLYGLFTKRLDRYTKYVETFTCEKITLGFDKEVAFHIDGDYVAMHGSVEVKAVKQQLRVVKRE